MTPNHISANWCPSTRKRTRNHRQSPTWGQVNLIHLRHSNSVTLTSYHVCSPYLTKQSQGFQEGIRHACHRFSSKHDMWQQSFFGRLRSNGSVSSAFRRQILPRNLRQIINDHHDNEKMINRLWLITVGRRKLYLEIRSDKRRKSRRRKP